MAATLAIIIFKLKLYLLIEVVFTNLEDRSRRNNLRIDGIQESERENWDITEKKVLTLFKDQLEIDESIEIDRGHRVGYINPNKPRTIVLRCLRYELKEEMKRCAKKLKGTGIYINDDFSRETLELRKALFQKATYLRSQGKGAKVIKDRLVTWDIEKDHRESGGEH